VNAVRTNKPQFGRIHRAVIFGTISKPPVPDQRPRENHETKLEKRQSPSLKSHKTEHKRRADRRSNKIPDKRDAQRAALIRGGKPTRDRARDVWESSRLAGSKQKPHDYQKQKTVCSPGEDREERPPDHNSRQRLPCAEVI